MSNQLTRGRAQVGALNAGGYPAKVLKTIEFTLTTDDFTTAGGAKGTATLDKLIPAQSTFDHLAVTYVGGFAGNGSALTSWGDGTDVDRYHQSGSINLFTTAANGTPVGDPSGTKYHTADGTPTVIMQGTSNFGSITAGTVSGYLAFWF